MGRFPHVEKTADLQCSEENDWRKQMMIYLFHPEPKAHN